MKYILTSPNFTGEVEIKFCDKTELLISFANNADLSGLQLISILERLPYIKKDINKLIKGTNGRLTEIQVELNFALFWDKYDYKVGNKKRAEKLWNSLNTAEKAKVIQYIPKYNAFLASKTNMERCYAETFLSQRRWDN